MTDAPAQSSAPDPAQVSPPDSTPAAWSGRGIEVVHVRRAFGAVLANVDVSLVAPPGEVTALIGPNGSGKTTLMLMLATLLAPDYGAIRIDGFDPVTQPREVRARIGWMPDGFGTWDALTVREVLHTIGAAYELPAPLVAARTEELLRVVHLHDLADRRARVLSRGQKQRLGLARALLHDPSTLILDEPASGLDPRSRLELRDILRSLASAGKTVLVSSHILSELQEVADRAVIIAGGATVESHTLDPESMRLAVTTWRITGLDDDAQAAIAAALTARGLPHRPSTSTAGTEVELAGPEAGARLLADLAGGGIPIIGFGPTHGALEAAYLAATNESEERR